ncbi:MAG: DNA methyltransferase, partial [Solirubrobacterales bacterium]
HGCCATSRSPPTSTSARATTRHPTVKPIDLMRWLIRLTAPANGLVLDPFCGSGTTGAGAVHVGGGAHGAPLLMVLID